MYSFYYFLLTFGMICQACRRSESEPEKVYVYVPVPAPPPPPQPPPPPSPPKEECTARWITRDFDGMRDSLRLKLHGQHLVQQTVVPALRGHFENIKPTKALSMSFHGWVGIGKTFVSNLIINHIFEKKELSNFATFIKCSYEFPSSNTADVEAYKRKLRSRIIDKVKQCERSVFIFEEVDKMDVAVLDAVKPFLDHFLPGQDLPDFRKSTFIFISNTGGREIAEKVADHQREGKAREEITLLEMEEVITQAALTQKGGFFKSQLITGRFIAHFIPFMPLERKHVTLCIRDYLESRGNNATPEILKAITNTLRFEEGFASHGCRNVEEKAVLYMQSAKLTDAKKEL